MELSEKARECRKQYQRDWNRKHPEKVQQYIKTYWEKKAASYTIADQAKDLHLQGLTQRQIAEQLNISVGSVNKYLNQKSSF
jgi:DNA-binding NarL/FixJ family response regulator